jgi:hypothetical protein
MHGKEGNTRLRPQPCISAREADTSSCGSILASRPQMSPRCGPCPVVSGTASNSYGCCPIHRQRSTRSSASVRVCGRRAPDADHATELSRLRSGTSAGDYAVSRPLSNPGSPWISPATSRTGPTGSIRFCGSRADQPRVGDRGGFHYRTRGPTLGWRPRREPMPAVLDLRRCPASCGGCWFGPTFVECSNCGVSAAPKCPHLAAQNCVMPTGLASRA